MQAFEPKAPYRAPETGFTPYGVGYVHLGDVIVESRILGDPAEFEIGMAMQLTLLALWPAPDGSPVVTDGSSQKESTYQASGRPSMSSARTEVTGVEVGLQHPLDAVEGAAHDRDRARRQAVSAERGRGHREQLGVSRVQLAHAHPRLEVEPGEHGRERRQQRRVRQPVGEVADVGRKLGRLRRAQRRTRRDTCPATPVGDHEPALAQDTVGGVDGRRAGAERGRQRAHGRQRGTRIEAALADRRLGAGRDLAGRRPGNLILC